MLACLLLLLREGETVWVSPSLAVFFFIFPFEYGGRIEGGSWLGGLIVAIEARVGGVVFGGPIISIIVGIIIRVSSGILDANISPGSSSFPLHPKNRPGVRVRESIVFPPLTQNYI